LTFSNPYFYQPSRKDRLMTVARTFTAHPPHRPATRALLYRINVAEAKLGVSRSTIYRLVHDGELELVKIGKRSSGITATSLHAMIERNKTPC
ncbi:helix-turn-helix transcriptional regulator, partial [Castellaniella caeni]|uniref:helix-turn-helix transcriptional regulator n=2 Tax=Alcaligenaceae TaxID=506 RepID=UPI00350E46D3